MCVVLESLKLFASPPVSALMCVMMSVCVCDVIRVLFGNVLIVFDCSTELNMK